MELNKYVLIGYVRPSNYVEGPNRFGTELCSGWYSPAGVSRRRIQTVEVVVMAAMVPMGIDFWASRRSPERLEPAMIPEQTGERQTVVRSM